MKERVLLAFFLLITLSISAQVSNNKFIINSPDKNLKVVISINNIGSLYYNVSYKNKEIIENSPLGLVSDISDFSKGLQPIGKKELTLNESYTNNRIKKSQVNYKANEVKLDFKNEKEQQLSLVFRVSDNDIAFKYVLPQFGEPARCIILKELTGFNFPQVTTTFLTPQATPMIGWKQTKPSYEEEYIADEPIGTPSKYKLGYTFPALFHVGSNGWALVSETGVNSLYCASKLSEGTPEGLYTIAFPEKEENNGVGSNTPGVSLPGETPWRTITVGENLKPIVESTITFDVVKQAYEPSIDYQFGRATWSWLEWQDESINFEDQKAFIDLSAQLGFELTLIDNWWDTKIGHKKIEDLVKYGKSKNVNVCLWYNSNGYWNDAPQGPKYKMNTASERKKEMAWMKSIGIKGIKVDFFGGDKQETLKLYEDILSDANEYGIAVIFHGCTLPRGWERMYPNFVSSEAVLASENLIFSQHANDQEAYNACLHPFIRNSVASMDFGPVLLNKKHNKNNDGGNSRKTSDTFQIATAVLFQSAIQNFGITPNNLSDCPPHIINFIKSVPTVWDETILLDGYPGKYCLIARRNGNKWYIAGINAEQKVKKIKINLAMFANKEISHYTDDKKLNAAINKMKLNSKGEITFQIQPNGGVIITD